MTWYGVTLQKHPSSVSLFSIVLVCCNGYRGLSLINISSKFPIAIQNSKYTVQYSKYTSHVSNTQSQVQKKYSENKSGQRPLIATRLSNALSFTAGDKFAPSNLIPGRHRNFFSSSNCDLGES